MTELTAAAAEWGQRTTGDLSTLLVELSRALKGLRFYPEGAPSRRDILDRAFLAWRVDLERAGPLELWIGESSFSASGVREPVAHGHLKGLAQALLDRGVERLLFTPDLARRAFHDLAELLAMDDLTIQNRGGLARALAGRSPVGIALNGEAPQSASRADEPACDRRYEPGDALRAAPAEVNPGEHSGASLGSSLLGPTGTPVNEFEDFTKPSMEEDPLQAPATDERDHRLRQRLRELDECVDDEAYGDLAQHVAHEASRLADEGLVNASYRAVLVLADHAVGHGGRSGVQLRKAQSTLEELLSGARLSELIDRTCDPEGNAAVRAAQVLLQLGGRAVSPLLGRLESESDSSRSAQITAVVIALGERAIPILVAAIKQGGPDKARTAIRLAGEIQSPNLLGTLGDILREGPSELRCDAARALAQIRGPSSVDALAATLENSDERLVAVVVDCLGAQGDPRACRPLLEHLDHALSVGSLDRADEAIRALSRLGSDDAVPKLVSILERRSFFRRAEYRGLKLAAIGALGSLPGGESRRALDRAARSHDAQVRQAAQQVVSRRR
jgi:HEAT repeat protein